MKNRLLSSGEAMVAAANIKKIEESLGHEIPTGVVNSVDLSSRLMSSGEVMTAASNIRRIEESRSYDKSRRMSPEDMNLLVSVVIFLFTSPKSAAEYFSPDKKGKLYHTVLTFMWLSKIVALSLAVWIVAELMK